MRPVPSHYLFFCHNIKSGLAINTVEYMPEINPTIRQKAKLFNTTPPHINKATAVNKVVIVVNMVRDKV